MIDIVAFLQSNVAIIGVLIALVTSVWGIVQFILIRRSENLQREFNEYHQLIRDLVQAGPGGEIYLDRQIAVLFELQRFKRYRGPTKLILDGLRDHWLKKNDGGDLSNLIQQLDETRRILERFPN